VANSYDRRWRGRSGDLRFPSNRTRRLVTPETRRANPMVNAIVTMTALNPLNDRPISAIRPPTTARISTNPIKPEAAFVRSERLRSNPPAQMLLHRINQINTLQPLNGAPESNETSRNECVSTNDDQDVSNSGRSQ
jgi:hypothetical protein